MCQYNPIRTNLWANKFECVILRKISCCSCEQLTSEVTLKHVPWWLQPYSMCSDTSTHDYTTVQDTTLTPSLETRAAVVPVILNSKSSQSSQTCQMEFWGTESKIRFNLVPSVISSCRTPHSIKTEQVFIISHFHPDGEKFVIRFPLVLHTLSSVGFILCCQSFDLN